MAGRHSHTGRISAAALLIALLVGTLVGLTKSEAATTKTFNATADTFVSAGNCTTNYGTNIHLKVNGDRAGGVDCSTQTTRQILLKFNVSGLVGNVTDAKLTFGTRVGNKKTMLLSASGAFTESTVTWNNRPAKGKTIGWVLASDDNSGATGLIATDFITNNTLYMKVTTIEATTADFNSREGGFIPRLTVTTDATAPTATTTPTTTPPGYTLTYSDDFNSLGSLWKVYTANYDRSQAKYIPRTVSVSDGFLNIETQRVCVGSGQTINNAPVSTAKCPAGTTTNYISGEVRNTQRWRSGRIEVRGKLPDAQTGVWPAIWMRQNGSWCTEEYGELDIMEWWADNGSSSRINDATATSHISCANDHTVNDQFNKTIGTDLTTGMHTWAMEWSPTSVKYMIDGTVLGTHTAADFPGHNFSNILDRDWELRFETQVVSKGESWVKAPDDNANFKPVTFKIDSVKVYRKN